MGANFAHDLASGEFGLTPEDAIRIHLTANHYPPVPTSMVSVCLEAIDLANEGEWDTTIELPEGVEWRGQDNAPVYAIVEAHHLDAFIIDESF